MSTQLIIQMCDQNPILQWCLIDKNLAIIESGENDISRLMKIAQKNPVILIIPAQFCTVHQINLPPGNRSALSKAIPYALEEKLIEDPNEYHFAFGDITPSQPVLVFTVNKNILNELLAPWKAGSAKVIAVVPELLSFPYAENEWHVFIKKGLAKSTLSPKKGFFCDISQLLFFMRHEMTEVSTPPPQKLKFYLYDNESVFPENDMTSLGVSTEMVCQPRPMIAYQSESIIAHMPINLLQGKLKNEFKINKKSNPGIYCISLTIMTLLLLIGNFTLETWMLYQQKQKNEMQIKSIYQAIFPDSTSITSPKIRIERKLQELSQSGNHDAFLTLTHQAVMVMQNQYDIRFGKFTYDNKKLTITFEANSPENYDKFIKALATGNVDVSEHTLSKQAGKIMATISIKEKKS